MAGPVTIECPKCGRVFDVPTELVSEDRERNQVLCRMDRSALYGHLEKCAGTTDRPLDAPVETHSTELAQVAPRVPQADLVGRIHLMLSGGHFMAKGGSGACTMCGTTRPACLERLKPAAGAAGAPCCALCRDGNTHPAPAENRGTCAEWGAEHGATS